MWLKQEKFFGPSFSLNINFLVCLKIFFKKIEVNYKLKHKNSSYTIELILVFVLNFHQC